MESMSGRVAIVTGGSRGYGAGIAAALKGSGVTVCITGRDTAALEKTAGALGVEWERADITSGSDWDRVMQRVTDRHGSVDILVNNAGAAIRVTPLEEQSDAEIEASISVNLTGALLGCRRAAPVMKAQGSGTIVNVSSVCQSHSWPGWSVYSAAKAGLRAASRSLYLELRSHGVRVTTLVPSWGATDFAGPPDLGDAPANDPSIRALCTKPEELGDVVVHLCSLPAHLVALEYVLLPTVQEISPL